jgi:hypothetical protein
MMSVVFQIASRPSSYVTSRIKEFLKNGDQPMYDALWWHVTSAENDDYWAKELREDVDSFEAKEPDELPF